MTEPRSTLLRGVVLGALAVLALAFALTLLVAYGGIYDVSARRGHTAAMRWMLDTTMQASVRSRAPEDGESALAGADVTAGAHEYKVMCQHCHGGPGVEPEEWSRGMLPRPPHLTDAAGEWKANEVFWIVSNGIKYTGMPAFGESHDEATLRDIAAFVQRLPGMTPAQYAAYGSEPAGHRHGGQDQRKASDAPSHDGGAAEGEDETHADRHRHAPHAHRPEHGP